MQFPILILFLYIAVGMGLTAVANRYLRNPGKRYIFTPLLEPEEFRPEGEMHRKFAIGFWYIGALVVVLTWLVI
jgi:hypothetical protein